MHKIVRWSRMMHVLLLISFPLVIQGQGQAGYYQQAGRGQRSLVNTFPFTLTEELEPRSFQDVEPRSFARQLDDSSDSIDFNSVASASAAGQRCIDKIIMEEETEYDDVYECNHSYNRRCHTSYSTTYSAQQEEECEDNYKKSCFIQYSPTAYDTTVKICRSTLVKDCSTDGPTVCSTEYISECETEQHEHQVEDDVADCRTEIEQKCNEVVNGYTTSQECSNWPIEKCDVSKKSVTKYTPKTACNKVPVEICGPSACPLVAGPEECFEKTKTITSEKPEEECSLEPRVECKHVTKLVPQLKPTEQCIDVPKEVCVRSRTNPRKVKKPVIKKWCYTPSPETGLEPLDNYNGQDSNSEPVVAEVCPRHCSDSISRGVCDPRCDEYAGLCPPCTPATPPPPPPPPACPLSCRPGFQRNGACQPECDIPECDYDPDCNAPPPYNPPPPPPACPLSCRPGFQRNGACQPECDIPECDYDPDCNAPPPYNPPPPPPTTPAPPPVTTPPACPRSCRPGFQNNGRCEVQCHIPECDYDPDCLAPPPPPTNEYLPPDEEPLPSYKRNGGGSQGRGLAPPRRGSRQFVPNFNTGRVAAGKSKSSSSLAGRARAETSPKFNNWDFFLKSGLIKRRG